MAADRPWTDECDAFLELGESPVHTAANCPSSERTIELLLATSVVLASDGGATRPVFKGEVGRSGGTAMDGVASLWAMR